MKFLDQAKIYVASGKGRQEDVLVLEEKNILNMEDLMEVMEARGGDIVFVTDQNLNTLIDFRYQQHFKAMKGRGWHGQK